MFGYALYLLAEAKKSGSHGRSYSEVFDEAENRLRERLFCLVAGHAVVVIILAIKHASTRYHHSIGFCHRPHAVGGSHQTSCEEYFTTNPEGEANPYTLLEVVCVMIQRYPVIPVYGLRVPTLPRLTPARRRFA